MSTESQIRANQANSQHSTGPQSDETKAVCSMNHFKYGLTGTKFSFVPGEDPDEFDHVLTGLRYEHQPATMTESILVEKMARSYWLAQRALRLQDSCLCDEDPTVDQQNRQLALYLRYQTTHDRTFHCALTDLLKLRAERRRNEIGFESHKRADAVVALRKSAENRKQERHKWDVLLAEAKVDHQLLQNLNLEMTSTQAAAAENRLSDVQKAA